MAPMGHPARQGRLEPPVWAVVVLLVHMEPPVRRARLALMDLQVPAEQAAALAPMVLPAHQGLPQRQPELRERRVQPDRMEPAGQAVAQAHTGRLARAAPADQRVATEHQALLVQGDRRDRTAHRVHQGVLDLMEHQEPLDLLPRGQAPAGQAEHLPPAREPLEHQVVREVMELRVHREAPVLRVHTGLRGRVAQRGPTAHRELPDPRLRVRVLREQVGLLVVTVRQALLDPQVLTAHQGQAEARAHMALLEHQDRRDRMEPAALREQAHQEPPALRQ